MQINLWHKVSISVLRCWELLCEEIRELTPLSIDLNDFRIWVVASLYSTRLIVWSRKHVMLAANV